MKEGDPHPNSGNVLPDGKWKFFRAYEFHKIDACLTTKDSPMGDYVSKEYPFGFADQNTAAVESQGAVDNAKYAYVMDEGYLRMMTLKERAKSGNGGKEWDYGTSAFYSCKFMRGNANSTAWASSNIRIYPGMRIETVPVSAVWKIAVCCPVSGCKAMSRWVEMPSGITGLILEK